jgi:TatD DNase family protein
VAEYIATLKDVSLRDVAQQTTDNFFKLFKLGRN